MAFISARHHGSPEYATAKADESCLEETFGWKERRKVGFIAKH